MGDGRRRRRLPRSSPPIRFERQLRWLLLSLAICAQRAEASRDRFRRRPPAASPIRLLRQWRRRPPHLSLIPHRLLFRRRISMRPTGARAAAHQSLGVPRQRRHPGVW
uniref:Uncharacterized protein n=1 Tax=Setaria italica TaxID=4555 RepID=K3ZZF9_SETIT